MILDLGITILMTVRIELTSVSLSRELLFHIELRRNEAISK